MKRSILLLLLAVLGLVAAAVALGAASASAAPTAANLQIAILVGPPPVGTQPPSYPNGASVTIGGLNFVAGLLVRNTGPDPATVKAQIELPAGLHWGTDGPDPSEACTVGETSVCSIDLGTQGNFAFAGWGWDVVADAVGSYTLKVQVIESSTSDPDTSDNASSVTVVVTQPAEPEPPPEPPAAVVASAVKVSPAKPKAGSTVVASVRVTRGGSALKPTGIACAATIGKTKIKVARSPRPASPPACSRHRRAGRARRCSGRSRSKRAGRASRRGSRRGSASEEEVERQQPTRSREGCFGGPSASPGEMFPGVGTYVRDRPAERSRPLPPSDRAPRTLDGRGRGTRAPEPAA